MTDSIPSNVLDAINETNLHTSPAAHAARHPGEEMARARATVAKGKLDEYIARSRQRGVDAARRVFSELPTDALVPASRLMFQPSGRGSTLSVSFGSDAMVPLHGHAQRQICDRLGAPGRYIADAATFSGDNVWRAELAAALLNEHAIHSEDRYLVRQAGGQVRGVMSDSFRRLDSRPLLDAFIAETDRAGLMIADGHAGDVRVQVKTIFPEVFELGTGTSDYGVFGMTWSNSDYGAGKLSLSLWVLRLICLNGATAESLMSEVHLGRRITAEMMASQRTIDLDTATMVSLTRDKIRGFRAADVAARYVDKIDTARGIKVADPIKGRLSSALSIAEQKRVRELFTGPEVVMLPAEPTQWRLSQTLGWLANESAADPVRAIELERLAGEILDGSLSRRKVEVTAYAAAE